MEKKTLLVNYFGMSTGGIEKYIAQLMRYAVKEGHRVVWFTTDGVPENAKQSGIVGNPGIEIIKFAGGRRKFFKKSPDLHLSENEDVVMISFVPEDYVWAEQFRNKYKCKTFYHHLILMNFFGFLTYPEDEFKTKFLSKRRAKLSNKLAHQFDDNQVIRAFADKQLLAYKDRYNLKYDISKDLLLKSFPIEGILSYDELSNLAKTRNEEFRIVTCARFQFPHKGYILGLLDVFSELRKKHDNVKLIIVGDGEKETFYKKYNSLPDYVKASIEIKGTLLFEDLIELYRTCHLAIGLAGSISASAARALPSLVVRHNTLDCETYGFFQDVDSTLKSDPGVDIIPYIQKIITCTDEEYVKYGIDAKKKHESIVNVDPDYILNEINKTSDPVVSKQDWRRNRRWAVISIMKKYFKFL